MKKLFATLVLMAALGFTAMPASAIQEGFGCIYQDTTTPGNGYINAGYSKTGTATCTSYFAIVGLGNCSVRAAMQAGRISSLSYYDTVTKNIVGFRKTTVKAYGN